MKPSDENAHEPEQSDHAKYFIRSRFEHGRITAVIVERVQQGSTAKSLTSLFHHGKGSRDQLMIVAYSL